MDYSAHLNLLAINVTNQPPVEQLLFRGEGNLTCSNLTHLSLALYLSIMKAFSLSKYCSVQASGWRG